MIDDEKGFRYPHVDGSHCIHCGVCTKACPENSQREVRSFRCFAAVNSDHDIVLQSSSGGIFSQLATRTLAQGGLVVGAVFTEDYQVTFTLIRHESELCKLRGAKYLQATIPSKLFATVKAHLQAGTQVLFSGTPCQIAAFNSYLCGKRYSTLILCEVICFGVPSPRVWRSYLEHVSRGNGGVRHLDEVSFRSKKRGWHSSSIVIRSGKKLVVDEPHGKNAYMRLFLRRVILRDSCANCRFKSGRSGADLSLGDFWSLAKVMPEMDNNEGVSMVLAHTPQGYEALRQCQFERFCEMPKECVDQCNPYYNLSAHLHFDRERYFRALQKRHYKWFNPKAYSRISPKRHGLIWKFFHRMIASIIQDK